MCDLVCALPGLKGVVSVLLSLHTGWHVSPGRGECQVFVHTREGYTENAKSGRTSFVISFRLRFIMCTLECIINI